MGSVLISGARKKLCRTNGGVGDRPGKAKQSRPAKRQNFLHKAQIAKRMFSRLTGLHHTSRWRNKKNWEYLPEGEAREAARRLEQVLLI